MSERPKKRKIAPDPLPLEQQDTSLLQKKRKRYLTLFFLIVGGIACLVVLYWIFVLRYEVYTDDAYVSGNRIDLSSQISGIASKIYTDTPYLVKEGQLLLEIDEEESKVAFAKSRDELAEAVRQVVRQFADVKRWEAELMVKQAALDLALEEEQNRIELVKIGAVSKEEFEKKSKALEEAKAALEATFQALEGAKALVVNTTVEMHPEVLKAAEQVKRTYLDLKRCKVLSPVTGYIAKRGIQLGEWVKPSSPLFSIVPLDQIWVDANFKEVQLAKIRIGQRVNLTADLYGRRVKYQGRVVGMTAGTGSVFSALPPQNATGNWIKIVQRVAVRIAFDPNELKRHPLWLGLSMRVKVDIEDDSGLMWQSKAKAKPLYTTDLYEKQIEGAEEVIATIIQNNR